MPRLRDARTKWDVRAALTCGVDINATDEDGVTALMRFAALPAMPAEAQRHGVRVCCSQMTTILVINYYHNRVWYEDPYFRPRFPLFRPPLYRVRH